MRVGELGVLRRQKHIAHQREFKTARNREAIDRANDRPRIGADCLGDINRATVSAEGKPGLAGLLQIDARRKGTAGAG